VISIEFSLVHAHHWALKRQNASRACGVETQEQRFERENQKWTN